MSTTFDLEALKEEIVDDSRYERRLRQLTSDNKEVDRIKKVVEESVENINKGQCSFVIYGEPQSGKTEMMIALTAKLLDEGFKIIVVLLNDSVQLLGQNLERFQRSGLSPAPKKSKEILSEIVKIEDGEWVIFSKKNARDLEKLIDKLASCSQKKVIIDDEADYATPNSRINEDKRSRINELTGELIGNDGVYIGVTATPARLDLNKTHDNQNESWIDFPPHSNYTGHEKFFPSSLSDFPFRLHKLPDEGDDPAYLRTALFSFMVNVAYLNTQINKKELNYSFLVHTSGRKADHSKDKKEIVKSFEILRDESSKQHEKYYKYIFDIATERYIDKAHEITRYIIENNARNNIVVMNSDKEQNAANNRTATDPTSPFTVVIGGNIVSRGVTFDNLLAMFFTRDVKHKIQQDTYIQRARMFGFRKDYLEYFELTIPKALYLDWQKCFIFHRLSLDSRRNGNGTPVWLESTRIAATARSSVDKARVVIDSGEMSFELFDYGYFEGDIKKILNKNTTSSLQKVRELSKLLGKKIVPQYLINYIGNFLLSADGSVAIHEPRSISGYRDNESIDKENIVRTRGFIGKRELEVGKYPNAIHHINILFNDAGSARVFYKYQGSVNSVKFLKTSK